MRPSEPASAIPLRAWPVEVFEHEPAHGYLTRLAERNAAHSITVFADSVGLNGRNPDPAEMLEFCLRFPVRNVEKLVAATPILVESRLVLNGQKFGWRNDWSMARPRVCDACLGENRYYRNWFDLTIIERCPIHDRPLIDGIGGVKFARWYPAVGATADGMAAVAYDVPRAAQIPRSWDAYVLGRVGVVKPFAVPGLDKSEMFAVVEAVELIGRASLAGWQMRRPPTPRTHSAQRRAVLARGFQIFRDDFGLEKWLESYCRSRPRIAGSAGYVSGFENFIGWLADALGDMSVSPVRTLIQNEMMAAAERHHVFIRKGRRAKKGTDGPLTQCELATALGITPGKVREIAGKLGITINSKHRRSTYLFSPRDLQTIKDCLGDLVPCQVAAALVGVSKKEFGVLRMADLFKPFLRLRNTDLFLQSEISGVLAEAQRSIGGALETSSLPLDTYCRLSGNTRAEVILRISKGEIVPSGWDAECVGYEAYRISMSETDLGRAVRIKSGLHGKRTGITILDAAILMGVSVTAVRALVTNGHLRPATAVVSGNRSSIEPESLRLFMSEFAPARIYTDVLRCAPRGAYPKLRALGITRIVEAADSGSFVRRSLVREVLKLESEPDEMSEVQHDEFWRGLRRYLEKERSTTRLTNIRKDGTAKLLSGDHRSSAWVKLNEAEDVIQFYVQCTRKGSPRMFRILSEQIANFAVIWPSLEVNLDCRLGDLNMMEVMHREMWLPGAQSAIYERIENRMSRLQDVLKQNRREILRS